MTLRTQRRVGWLLGAACLRLLLSVGVVIVMATGCGRETSAREPGALIATVPNSAGLEFRLRELGQSDDGSARYLALADGGASPCEFEIVLGKTTASSGSSFSFGSASLVRRASADCTNYLETLAPLLGFEGALPTPAPLPRLDLSIAILGTRLSRSLEKVEIAGGFVTDPPGTWIATKLFLSEGEGEIFLNLNPDGQVGECSIKDQDYATTVLTELGKILLPERRSG